MFVRGDLVAILGWMGADKTLAGVATSMLVARYYHMPIWSNVASPYFLRIRTVSSLTSITNSVILWDEVMHTLDSCKFGSETNIFLTRELTLVRKKWQYSTVYLARFGDG